MKVVPHVCLNFVLPLFVLFFCWIDLSASSIDSTSFSISEIKEYTLSQDINYFEACESSMSIELAANNASMFDSVSVGIPADLKECGYFGRLRLVNNTGFQSWAIRVSKAGLSHFKMALKTSDGEGWSFYNSGLFEPVASQQGYFPIQTEDNIIDILLPREDTVSFLFYFQNDRMYMSPELGVDIVARDSGFYNSLHEWKNRTFIVTGLFLFLILLGLSLFFNTKDKAFLYYALYLISLLSWIYFSGGILNDWLANKFFPENPELSNLGFNVLICYVFYISFLWEFATLKLSHPELSKIYRYWMVYIVCFIPTTFGSLLLTNFNFVIFFKVGIVFNLGMILFTIYVLHQLWPKRKDDNVNYVLIGFFLMLLLLSISTTEIIRNDFQVPKFPVIAIIFVIEILFFLWALARRYKNYISLQTEHLVVAQNLAEKDVLLREIHHRVKNNLQVISALLTLQSSHLKDAQAKEALREGQDRVQSMALIHKDLYQHENLKGVNTKDYLEQLINNLMSSYNIGSTEIEVELDIEELLLDVDTMIPLGLTINELISNALKHAYHENDHAKLNVYLKEENGVLKLKIKDNGKGVGDVDVIKQKSFGYSLIQSFAKKLDADLRIKSDNGLVIELDIKNYKLLNS